MSAFSMRKMQAAVLCGLAVSSAALLLTPAPALAGWPPFGIPSGVLPWEAQKYYRGYVEPHGYESRAPQPPEVRTSPAKYRIETMQIPHKHTADNPNAVILMAHVPEDASIWLQGQATRLRGMIRYFESPGLERGSNYLYTVRVVWYEDGKWVTQEVQVPVKAGDVYCIDIVQADAGKAAAEVAASLAKLSPLDQKLARAQKMCAIQNDKELGSMGVPAQITLKGQPVFLCCDACIGKAKSAPDQTLSQVQKLKEMNAGSSRP